MKKYLMMGAAAVAFASCSHDMGIYNPDLADQLVVETYNQAFIDNFGVPAPSQTWGFGDVTRGATRAVFDKHWNGKHDWCKFDELNGKFNFTKPENAVDLTSSDLFDQYGNLSEAYKNKDISEWYIPADYPGGTLNLHNLNLKGNVYVLGKLGELQSVNYNGTVTFYIDKDATMTYSVQSGNRHTVINAGTLTVVKYANIGDVYNKGTLTLSSEGGKADIPNDMHIYSDGEATITVPNGADLKAVCDIHGTMSVTGNLKIQNGTNKYICGIDATGTVENVDGAHVITSYLHANEFKFDGNPIYLTEGGHIVADTKINMPNSNCQVYAVEGSTALVEAPNFEFGNKNDFTHAFSDNIYFKVNGGYIKVDNCYAMGHSHYFNNVAEYLASNAHAENNQTDEYALAADRINAGNATGSPKCGQPWTVGTPTPEKLTFLCRVFCEDLSASAGNDFDFNDVVFDVYNNATTGEAKIVVLAAGGTLPLTVCGQEVHGLFGVEGTDVMINTNANLAGWKSANGLTAKEITGLTDIKSTDDVKTQVEVRVQKTNINQELGWYRLTAEQGEPAAMFAVPSQSVKWCNERTDIKEVYDQFDNWVQYGSPENWYESIAEGTEINLY